MWPAAAIIQTLKKQKEGREEHSVIFGIETNVLTIFWTNFCLTAVQRLFGSINVGSKMPCFRHRSFRKNMVLTRSCTLDEKSIGLLFRCSIHCKKGQRKNFYMVFTSSSYFFFLFVVVSHRPKICVFSLIGLYVSPVISFHNQFRN